MKPHRILKSFKGSQTGNDTHNFEAGKIAHLSDSLAAIVVKAGWAEEYIEHTPAKADDREAKVLNIPEKKAEETINDIAEQPKKKRKA